MGRTPPRSTGTTRFRIGQLLLSRFRIERLAAEGGMGMLYRGLDERTGYPVAIKLLQARGRVSRFLRECRILDQLDHPRIVRYVAQGQTPASELFLVMEWLEGPDLNGHLQRGLLSVPEAVELGRAVCSGLAYAHSRGVIHRDLKPSNLVVVDGELSQVKLVDFGVARWLESATPLTGTGAVVGSAGYLAPEQAKGEPVDGRADLFSLGCVLYQALAGVEPFGGGSLLATISRLLQDEPRPLRELVDVPERCAALITRLLCKSPAGRPSDAQQAVELFSELASGLSRGGPERPARRGLSSGEQRRCALLLAISPHTAVDSLRAAGVAGTVDLVDSQRLGRIRAAVGPGPATLSSVAPGVLAGTFGTDGEARDQALIAARTALVIQRVAPEQTVVVVLARCSSDPGAAPGHTAALAVLDRLAARPLTQRVGVHTDATVAALIDDHFELVAADGPFRLVSERSTYSPVRLRAGRESPWTGREEELARLTAGVSALLRGRPGSAALPAILIEGPSGSGKSRLLHELLQTLAGTPAPRALPAQGEPGMVGPPLSMLARLVRRCLGVGAQDDLAKVEQALKRRLPAETAQALEPLVGPLAALVAGRRPELPALRTALEGLMAAERRAAPVLLLLDDLQWADAESLDLLAPVLKVEAAHGLLLVATARPGQEARWKQLAGPAPGGTLRLAPLAEHPSIQLVRALAPAATVDSTIERAQGNPFLLEQLCGLGDALPEAALAQVEARLISLPPGPRRVLRAASLQDEIFSRPGLRSLLGAGMSADDLERNLTVLCERQLLVVLPAGRPVSLDEVELAFHDRLLREAARAGVLPSDLALATELSGGTSHDPKTLPT